PKDEKGGCLQPRREIMEPSWVEEGGKEGREIGSPFVVMLAVGTVGVEGGPGGVDGKTPEETDVKEGFQPPGILAQSEEQAFFCPNIDRHKCLLKEDRIYHFKLELCPGSAFSLGLM